ncbi:MAG: hypothetical protein ABWJ42_01180 [Sulfolobales archaeon]
MSTSILCGEKKRAGGKLVKVCMRVSGDTVSSVIVTGDFFAEPEEVFERTLLNLSSARFDKSSASREIVDLIYRSGMRIYGVSLEDVREAVEKALSMQRD